MTSSVLMRLCNIALKPGISASTQLITARRICRIVSERLDYITAERRAFRCEANKLKPFLPFAKQAIADIGLQALAHREVERIEREPSFQGLESRLFSTVRTGRSAGL